jgi:DNA (cytosine-5)-methyltransferase 1
MSLLDLCSGIGGLTLGYLAHGYQPALFCEQNEYCQQILKARFGNVPIISNIENVTAIALSNLGIHNIDGIVAGLPCPAFSVAGKQKASKDERNLFPEFFRIVCEIQPRWFVIENVPGLLTAEGGRFFAGVLREIATFGFDAEWGIISAASLGAVHLRERVFIIAYTNGNRCDCGANNWGKRPIHSDAQRNFETASTKRKQLLSKSRETGAIPPNPESRTPTQLFGRDRLPQARANTASVSCGDADTGGNRCEQQLSETNQGGEECILRDGLFNNPLLEPKLCGSDDGVPSGMDRHLLRHRQLTDWLAAATIPRVNRLSSRQVGALSPTEQQAYRECWKQYQQVRREHKEAIAALGNAVVPQAAVKVFQRLKDLHV